MNGLITTALDWTEACDRLRLPYDQRQLGDLERVRVWDEIDRIRRERERGGAA